MAEAGERAAPQAPLRILLLNQIAQGGLARLPAGRYLTGTDIAEPDAVLVRSADLHAVEMPPTVRAVARAGAGTNNIPVAALSARGVPVFNAPGANANAVKELVVAGMLIAARNLAPAMRFVQGLDPSAVDLDQQVEQGKKEFAGAELAGQTLGIVGLGRIGCLVADAAIKLGMQVMGFDPEITVDAAWSLPAQVRRAGSVDEVLRKCDFVSLHVPLVAATRDLVGEKNIGLLQPGAVLLNFSRQGVVNDAAVVGALDSGQLGWYVCDFPASAILRQPRVVALPHLGASTSEAEENCALMVAEQLRDYLENGNIVNSVNYPTCSLGPLNKAGRIAICHKNEANMIGTFTSILGNAKINIDAIANKSRGDFAYTLIDTDSAIPATVVQALAASDAVIRVRVIK